MKLRGKTVWAQPRRILLVQLRRIGDTLLCTPAIRALAGKFPDARIDFVAEKAAHETLLGHPQVDRLLVAPRRDGARAWLRFVKDLRREKYDWAIDFLSNPRSAQFTYLSGATTRVGLNRFGRRWAYTHHVIEERVDQAAYAVDLRLEVLRLLGVESRGRDLEIFCDSVDPEAVDRAMRVVAEVHERPIVAVATGSANSAKRYPADLTGKVIEHFRAEGFGVVLTSGPGESEFAEQILRQLSSPIPWLRGARVPALTALYRRVSLYVGPDSGPKHVAVACRIPTVTVFGPGQPSNWNDPLNQRNVVIAAPCDLRPACVESECATRGCLRRILPDEIVAAGLRLLRE